MQYFDKPDAYTNVSGVIYDVEEFMRTFDVGDRFWVILWPLDLPVGVSGPHKIIRFDRLSVANGDLVDGPQVVCGRSSWLEKHSVEALTNRFHGVTRTKRQARRQLARMRKTWATVPELIKRAEHFELGDLSDNPYWD